MITLRQTMIISGLTLLSLLIASCSKAPVGPGNAQGNLIGNPDFQEADTASLEGWTTSGLTQVVAIAPPAGGRYSLQLEPGWLGTGGFTYARTYVTNQSGTGIYDLSLWGKSFANFTLGVSIGLWSQGRFYKQKSYTTNDTLWHSISILDTLATQSADTIAVELDGGAYETINIHWKALCAMIKLERAQ
jgi:hypothetical protein